MIEILDAFVWLTGVAFVSNVIYYVIVYKMPSLWRSSFSYGELLIVSHSCVAFVSTSGACVVTKLFNPSLSYMFCSTHTPTLVLQVIYPMIETFTVYHLFTFKSDYIHWNRFNCFVTIHVHSTPN